MTNPNPRTEAGLDGVGLLACPFCGGEAKWIDVNEDEGFDNIGGSCIACTRCNASSNVQFGRKENLLSDWNTRAPQPSPAAVEVERDALERRAIAIITEERGAEWAVPKIIRAMMRFREESALSLPAAVDEGWRELEAATKALIASKVDTFKARNGRHVGIEDDSGEKCWIVPFDDMAALERAVAAFPAPPISTPGNGEGE